MPNLTIVKAGLMTSIQDMGRKGFAYYAIPQSGVMDSDAAQLALSLLNQSKEAPVLEITTIAPHIKFTGSTQISLTGADFGWRINNQQLERNTVITIEDGDCLVGKFAKDGMRGYLAINGAWKVDKVYHSYATYPNAQLGGLHGRLLQKGDRISWMNKTSVPILNTAPVTPYTTQNILIRRGPEFDFLTKQAKATLTNSPYKIDADSNRMGARLIGKPLESSSYQLTYSAPILPGFVQLPPSGMPIVLLQDGQISGGYPRIAYIPEKFLSVFNQIPLGETVRFHW